MPSLHFRVPGGTIKLKTYTRMSETERSGAVPVWKFGRWRLVWRSNREKAGSSRAAAPAGVSGHEVLREPRPAAPAASLDPAREALRRA